MVEPLALGLSRKGRCFQWKPKYIKKIPLIRVRLRQPDGQIADQYSQHAILTQYVRVTWQGPSELPLYACDAPGVPFSFDDLVQAIAGLHTNKSVAQPFLPAIVYKGTPHDTASWLFQHLNQWWGVWPPKIPSCWKNSWLFFLPKPGKSNSQPEHLRPISLMEPLGKLVIGLLAAKLKVILMPQLARFPHFGFLPYRAATDAICRVARHCRCIRLLVSQQRRTVLRQMERPPQFVFCGGISIYVDMTRAFDCVHRPFLIEQLWEMGSPADLLTLVTAWHTGTKYVLSLQDRETEIPANVGVRQGCKLAPLLWVIYMQRLISQLATRVPMQWIMEHVTFYADDIHTGCEFHSKQEFQAHLQNIGHLFDTIEALKLQLSYSKTFAILAVAGSNFRPALKGHTQRSAQGMQVLIPRASGHPTAVPLKSHGKYLGVVMSYGAFEDQTWQHRCKASWSAFQRLRPWLQNRQIQLRHRYHLWHTSVFTVMTYGLLATGFSTRAMCALQQNAYRMLRQVIGDHAYMTHNTHYQALQQQQFPHPLQLLRHLAMGMQFRLERRVTQIASDDVLHDVDWSHLPEVIQMIQHVEAADHLASRPHTEGPENHLQVRYQCQFCAFVATNVPNLRRHLTTQHDWQHLRTSPIHVLSMAHLGRHQCKSCFQMFSTWRQFQVHLERDCCHAFGRCGGYLIGMTAPASAHGMVPELVSLDPAESYHVSTQSFWSELKEAVRTKAWGSIHAIYQACQYLAHTCLICGLWCNRFQELHAHYRLHHAAQALGCVAKGAQLLGLTETDSPCCLCLKLFKRTHSCNVALQLGVIHLHGLALGDTSLLKCELCDQEFSTLANLYQHLSATHDLTIHDWCPARDAHQSSDACAHCGALFITRAGLQRHIVEGRCQAFDPMASPQPLDAAGKWNHILRQGDFSRQGLTAVRRLQLTLHCQFCGSSYSRQGDLISHLLQHHSALWHDSQPILRFLLQLVQASLGCLCNPCAQDSTAVHVCGLYRQLAMIFHCSTLTLLVPTQFHEGMLQKMLRTCGNSQIVHTIHQILRDRAFDQLWLRTDVQAHLRKWCVKCGGAYHPAGMLHHLWSHHADDLKWAAQIIFQLQSCFLTHQTQDFQCSLCGIVYNSMPSEPTMLASTDRCTLQQLHFTSNCPVLYQVALLLLPSDGCADGSCRSGADAESEIPGSSSRGGQRLQARKRRRTGEQKGQGPIRLPPGQNRNSPAISRWPSSK